MGMAGAVNFTLRFTPILGCNKPCTEGVPMSVSRSKIRSAIECAELSKAPCGIRIDEYGLAYSTGMSVRKLTFAIDVLSATAMYYEIIREESPGRAHRFALWAAHGRPVRTFNHATRKTLCDDIDRFSDFLINGGYE